MEKNTKNVLKFAAICVICLGLVTLLALALENLT